ncbi:MAG: ketoacyl-ACP synthase III [Pirellulaceae bacterium]|nr:ketoacyl-ACP synthase III [Pirellulaceae bacterium]
MSRMMGVQLAAVGSYLPERIVPNEDLSDLGCDSEWIQRRTGICQRRRAAPDQATSDLAVLAAQRCLDNGETDVSEVDLLIVATMTPDHLSPSTACHVQRQLGCVAPAMDVSAACAGFMYALVTAGQFVRSGSSQCALVIGSEVMSRITNPSDVKTFPVFGDGAGAVLLRPTADTTKGLESYTLGAEGSSWQTLYIPAGGSRQALTPQSLMAGDQYLHMEGQSVFKWAVRSVTDSMNDCLEHARLSVDDIDLFILHQANIRILDAAISTFDIGAGKVFVNLNRYGNTSSASIPIVLDEARRSGALKPNSRAMLCGFGAGLTWGTAIVQL